MTHPGVLPHSFEMALLQAYQCRHAFHLKLNVFNQHSGHNLVQSPSKNRKHEAKIKRWPHAQIVKCMQKTPYFMGMQFSVPLGQAQVAIQSKSLRILEVNEWTKVLQ